MPKRKVFISAVSGELKSYRLPAEQTLKKRDYEPAFQEVFDLTDLTLLEMLRKKISECDAVICLIGFAYGGELSPLPDREPRRSFAQWEFDLAQKLGKRVYRLMTTETTPPSPARGEGSE